MMIERYINGARVNGGFDDSFAIKNSTINSVWQSVRARVSGTSERANVTAIASMPGEGEMSAETELSGVTNAGSNERIAESKRFDAHARSNTVSVPSHVTFVSSRGANITLHDARVPSHGSSVPSHGSSVPSRGTSASLRSEHARSVGAVAESVTADEADASVERAVSGEKSGR